MFVGRGANGPAAVLRLAFSRLTNLTEQRTRKYAKAKMRDKRIRVSIGVLVFSISKVETTIDYDTELL